MAKTTTPRVRLRDTKPYEAPTHSTNCAALMTVPSTCPTPYAGSPTGSP